MAEARDFEVVLRRVVETRQETLQRSVNQRDGRLADHVRLSPIGAIGAGTGFAAIHLG